MKSYVSNFARGISRSAFVAAVAFSLSAVAAQAATKLTVPVNLAGKEFGNGTNLHAQSTDAVQSGTTYFYRITGKVVGTGQLSNLISEPTPIASLVKEFAGAAAAKNLVGTKEIVAGEIFDKTYDGDVTRNGVTAHFHLTITISVTGGVVNFDVKNVSITVSGFPPSGTIMFEPNSKVLVGIAPVIEMQTDAIEVSEAAGTVSVFVKRNTNLNAESVVSYTTQAGTATSPADFTAKHGQLNFPAGEDTRKITIKINDNGVNSANRQFVVKLLKPVAALLGAPKSSAVTILDNDAN